MLVGMAMSINRQATRWWWWYKLKPVFDCLLITLHTVVIDTWHPLSSFMAKSQNDANHVSWHCAIWKSITLFGHSWNTGSSYTCCVNTLALMYFLGFLMLLASFIFFFISSVILVLLILFLTAKSSENLPSTGSDLYSGRSHEDGSRTGWCGSFIAPFFTLQSLGICYVM